VNSRPDAIKAERARGIGDDVTAEVGEMNVRATQGSMCDAVED
jgi:hypothetical protein